MGWFLGVTNSNCEILPKKSVGWANLSFDELHTVLN